MHFLLLKRWIHGHFARRSVNFAHLVTALAFASALLALAGIAFTPWPSSTTATELTAREQIKTAWDRAKSAGTYQFTSHVEQVTVPAPTLANQGLESSRQQLDVEGETDLPGQKMRLTIWTGGKSSAAETATAVGPAGIEVKTERGQAFGRVVAGDWQVLENPTGLIAPDGDLLTFLIAAQAPAASGHETRSEIAFTRYTFKLDGQTLAAFLRDQTEAGLRQKGKLPSGAHLDLPATYRVMQGEGELWIGDDGLPARLIVHLRVNPAEKDRVEAEITTDFSHWGNARNQGTNLPSWAGLDSALPLPAGWQLSALTLAFGLASVAGLIWIVRNRRHRLVYRSIFGIAVGSLVLTPVIEATRWQAFAAEQDHGRSIAAERASESQAVEPGRADVDRPSIDPHADPLTAGRSASGSGLAKPQPGIPAAVAATSADPSAEIEQTPQEVCRNNSLDSDGDGLCDAYETLIGTDPTNPDTDGDGLSDGLEVLQIGTQPRLIDTDGDGLSDGPEVRGFTDAKGLQWYLDPTRGDTNRDGRPDGIECTALANVNSAPIRQQDIFNANGPSPTGACEDTDGDGTPDVWDDDDDNDLVPDQIDLDPRVLLGGGQFEGGIAGLPNQTFNLQVTDQQVDWPLLVEFQLRPANPKHLWYSMNVLDWPVDDRDGQIQRVFGDSDKLGNSGNAANGNLRLVPMLELEIPFQPGQSGGLPVRSDFSGQIGASTPVTAWLDTARLKPFGISVRKKDDLGNLLAYAPISVTRDRIGSRPVAFASTMYFRPTTTSPIQAQDVRLIWALQARVDSCDTTQAGNISYDQWCAGTAHWQSDPNPTIIHSYYDDWYVTGLLAREDHGMQVGLIAEDPRTARQQAGFQPNLYYEDRLWELSRDLDHSFLAGRGSASLDLSLGEIQRRFDGQGSVSDIERWGLPRGTFRMITNSFENEALVGQIAMTTTKQFLTANFIDNGQSLIDRPTVLFLRQETYRNAGLTTQSGSDPGHASLSLSPSAVATRTLASMSWAPFTYRSDAGWQPVSLDTYVDSLEPRLRAALMTQPDLSSDPYVLDGSLTTATSYYVSLVAGTTQVVAIDDRPVPTKDVRNDPALQKDSLQAIKYGNFANRLVREIATYASESYVIYLRRLGIGTGAIGRTLTLNNPSFADVQSTIQIAGLIATTIAQRFANSRGQTISFYVQSGLQIWAQYSAIMSARNQLTQAKATFNSENWFRNQEALDAVSDYEAVQSVTTELPRAMYVAAVIGTVIAVGAAVAFFVMDIRSNHLAPGTLGFDYALAGLFAAVAVAILELAISLIPVIGQIIMAIVSLIDVLASTICKATGYSNDWVCGGITGLATKAFQYLIFSETPIVDMSDPNRLQLGGLTTNLATPNLGFVPGSQVDIGMVVTSTISRGHPEGIGYLYWWMFGDQYLRDSNFNYQIQKIASGLGEGPHPDWQSGSSEHSFNTTQPVAGSNALPAAGVNQKLPLNLAEHYSIKAQRCFMIYVVFVPVPVCYLRNMSDTNNIDLSPNLIFDVLPGTLDEFYALTDRGKQSFSLAWDSSFPILCDADGDGLRSQACGGNDPDDSNPDVDSDGLSDYDELMSGTDPLNADTDQDGLSDFQELLEGTNPRAADADGDGLIDCEEFPHILAVPDPYGLCPSTSTGVTGGWTFVYGFDSAGRPLQMQAVADPHSVDPDGDTILDKQEKVYGYNPQVPSQLNVLEIANQVSEPGSAGSRSDGFVRPGQNLSYTAEVHNDLTNREASGLLEVEFPAAAENATALAQPFTLQPRQTRSLNGTVGVRADITTSQQLTFTNRAGAEIVDPSLTVNGRSAWLHLDDPAGSTRFFDASLNGNDATCSTSFCPAAGQPGYGELSAQFNGQGQYLNLPGADRLGLAPPAGASNQSFTVAAWVKGHLTDVPEAPILDVNWQTIPDPDGVCETLQLNIRGGRPFLGLNLDDLTGNTVLDNTSWWHLTWRIDYLNGTARSSIFVNGVLDSSKLLTTCAGGYRKSGQLWLGQNAFPPPLSTTQSFNGQIDELEIYSRALADEEIRAQQATSFDNQIVRRFDYRFDEPPGATGFRDSSGNELTLECDQVGCPTSGFAGRSNQAARFDGQDDSLTLLQTPYNGIYAAYSLAAWVRPDATGGMNIIALSKPSGPLLSWSRQLRINAAGQFEHYLWDISSNGGPRTVTGSTVVVPGRWYHVAGSATPNGTMQLFVNGVQEGLSQPIGIPDGGDRWIIGGRVGSGTGGSFGNFTGLIDNLAMIDYALGQPQIQQLMVEVPLINLHFDDSVDSGGKRIFADSTQSGRQADCPLDYCPATGAKGLMRQAPVFNGQDDALTMNADGLNLGTYSLAFWVRPSVFQTNRQFILGKGQSTGQFAGFNRQFEVSIDPGSMKLHFAADGDYGNGVCYAPLFDLSTINSLNLSQWNQVVLSYQWSGQDNDPGIASIYLNGSLDSRVASLGQLAMPSCGHEKLIRFGAPIGAGSSQGTPWMPFAGQIDEFLVFNPPLSAANVKENYDYQAAWYDVKTPGTRIVIDADKPFVQLGAGADYVRRTGQVRCASAFDPTSAVVSVEWNSGSGWQPASPDGRSSNIWCFVYQPASDGPASIQVRATDRVGNVSDIQTATFVVDGAAPVLSLDPALTRWITPVANGTVELSGTAVDAASGVGKVEVTLLDSAGAPISRSQSIRSVPSGESLRLPFDEPPGATRFRDASGHGLDGVCGDLCPQSGSPGRLGQSAVSFNGSGGVVAVPLTKTLTSPTFSVGFWTKTSTSNCWNAMVDKGRNAGQNWYFLSTCALNNERPGVIFGLPGARGPELKYEWGDSDWHYVVGTFDGSTQALYIDGLQRGSARTGPYQPVDSPIQVGRRLQQGIASGSLTGQIDDLRIYPRALKTAEIQTLDAGTWRLAYAVPPETSGRFQVKIVASDNLGNSATTLAGTIQVDGTAPVADITYTGPYTQTISGTGASRPVLSGTVSDIPYPSNPTLALHFEESAVPFLDSSVQRHPVTCVGGCPGAGAAGYLGQAAQFDGLGKSLVVPDDSTIGSYTLAVWVKPASVKAMNLVVRTNEFGPTNAWSHQLRINSQGEFEHYAFDGVAGLTVTGSTVVVPGTWYHVAAVATNGGSMRLYVNGREEGTARRVGTLWTGGDRYTIGAAASQAGAFGNAYGAFAGLIDDLVVYNRVLGPTEIAAIGAPVSAGLNKLEIGFVPTPQTDFPGAVNWRPVTLKQSGQTFSTWNYQIPEGLEGPYQIRLRATDGLSNTRDLPARWSGDIDTLKPRLVVTETVESGGFRYTTLAEDFNLSESGFSSPCGPNIISNVGYFTATWYAAALDQVMPADQSLLSRKIDRISATCLLPAPVHSFATATDQAGNVGTDPAPGEQIHLAFDEPAGATRFVDASGHGLDATCGERCPLSGTPGRIGQALTFDGSGGVAVVPPAPALSSTVFSVAFWARLPGVFCYDALVDKGRNSGQNWYFLTTCSQAQAGQGPGIIFGTPGGQASWPELMAGWGDTGWHHIAGTFDGLTATLYVDGNVHASVPIGRYRPTITPIQVGLRINTGDHPNPLTGQVDDLRVFDRVLSSAELQEMIGLANPALRANSSLEPEGGASPSSQVTSSTPLSVTLDKRVLTSADYGSGGAVYLSGGVSGTDGPIDVRLSIGSLNVPVGVEGFAGRWTARWLVDPSAPPDGLAASISITATDASGRSSRLDDTLSVDVAKPSPFTVTASYLDAGGKRIEVRPGATISDIVSPTIRVNWSGAQDGNGIARYWAGWTSMPDLTNAQISGLTSLSPDAREFSQTLGEARKVYAQVVAEDFAGNRTQQTFGPVYVDWIWTSDYLGLDEPGGPYSGWLQSGCSRFGIDGRLARTITPKSALSVDQQLYASWNGTTLRLAWLGANWDRDGELFIYLAGAGSGTTLAWNPHPNSPVVHLPISATHLIRIRDARTAELQRWDGTGWTEVDGALSYRSTTTSAGPQSDLAIAFSTLGITNPSGTDLGLIAFATEENASDVWATMPPSNPVTSARLVSPDRIKAITAGGTRLNLIHGYTFRPTPGACLQPLLSSGADLAVALRARPESLGLVNYEDGWVTRQGDAKRFAVGDGETLSYRLEYTNRGSEPALNVSAVLTGSNLRLSGSPAQIGDHVWRDTFMLGDLAPGASRAVTVTGNVSFSPNQPQPVFDGFITDQANLAVSVRFDRSELSGGLASVEQARHQIDLGPPGAPGIVAPRSVIGTQPVIFRGVIRDQGDVPRIDLEAQTPAGNRSTVCANPTPAAGAWTCIWDPAAGLSNDQTIRVRARGTDRLGRTGDWSKYVDLRVDAQPPQLDLDQTTKGRVIAGTLSGANPVLLGQASDNRRIAQVEVCREGGLDCRRDTTSIGRSSIPTTTAIFADAPVTAIPIGSSLDCATGRSVVRTFAVGQAWQVGQVKVGVDLSVADRRLVSIILRSPMGTEVQLRYPGDTSNQNLNVLFDDLAGQAMVFDGVDHATAPSFRYSRRPDGALARFNGEGAQGTWSLIVCDPYSVNPDQDLYLRASLILSADLLPANDSVTWRYPISYPGPVDGITNTFSLTGIDLAGNRGQSLTLDVRLDNVAPKISVANVVSRSVLGSGPVLAGSAIDGSGLRTLYATVKTPGGAIRQEGVEISGASAAGLRTSGINQTWRYTPHVQRPGRYEVTISAVDLAGNLSRIGPFSITLLENLTPRFWMPSIARQSVTSTFSGLSRPVALPSTRVTTSTSAVITPSVEVTIPTLLPGSPSPVRTVTPAATPPVTANGTPKVSAAQSPNGGNSSAKSATSAPTIANRTSIANSLIGPSLGTGGLQSRPP